MTAMIDRPDDGSETPRVLPLPGKRPIVILPDGSKPVPLGSGVITALIGEGGMANVYEIWNSQLEVHRAVKLVHPNCSEEAKQRFQTEIKITAKLHHPNIIEIHGVGEWNGLPFIEMERLHGLTLEEVIKKMGALSVEASLAIGIMISRALAFAHNQEYVIYGHKYHGVIHRDLKPSNIMICRDGSVKLMDFGIARPTDASIHTTDGAILGTLQYLSPEQLDGRELDVRTDVYSLGTTLYEALTGVKAFPERNVSRLMMDKVRNRFRPLEDYDATYPRRLRRLIHRCMHHDRDRRIRTAPLLLGELERIHRCETIDPPEQVLRRLLSSAGYEKVILATHRRFPFKLVAAAVLIAGAIVPATRALMRFRELHPGESKPTAATPITPPLPLPPPIPVDESSPVEPKREVVEKSVVAVKPSAVPDRPPIRRTDTARSERSVIPPPSFVDEMIEKHGSDDLLSIMTAEVRAGEFAAALRLFDHLSDEQKAGTKALLYKLRALQGLGDLPTITSFLAAVAVNDGEVHLARAKVAYERKSYDACRSHLKRSLASPRALLDYDRLKRDVYFYQAMCATAEFDAAPTESSYKAALDAWYQLRSALRDEPNHQYNSRAQSETQRIGEAFRAMKG